MYYAKDRDEAADFLQEGFITVFGKLHLYKFEGSFEGWVRRIIVNTALSALRKKKRFMEVNTPIEEFPETDTFNEDVTVIPSGKVIEMVGDLPLKAGTVLKLYAIEGYSHQEIAEIMDISVGTSKSQLNRARTLLKKAFNHSNG
jgi:RNA polymerase sigma-70 factor (ECF subfamily)